MYEFGKLSHLENCVSPKSMSPSLWYFSLVAQKYGHMTQKYVLPRTQ